MNKKLLNLLLVLVLCLALLPVLGTKEAHAWESNSLYINVGGTEITTDNASDVFGDGTVSYDAATKTLTLNNYTYTGQGWKNGNEFWGMTVASGITIELKGENSIQLTAADPKCKSYGIYISTYDDVTFKGSGSLMLRGGDITEGTSTSYESGGIRAPWADMIIGNDFTGTITAKGGNVSGSGITYGFYTISELSVYNGKLVAIGGEHSGTGETISCGYYGGSKINIYGGEVSFFGGNVSSTDNQAHSYGIAHSYYSPTVNIFDGILIAQGGNATGNDYVYSIGMESGTLNAYGGITIAQGGDASKNDTTDFNSLRSYGLGADVNAYGGAVVARAGTVNGGFRVTTKITSKTKENNRLAISYLKLGSDSVIAKAAGWSDHAGASGFGDLTVTSDHSTRKFIEGTVGGVSNYREALAYNYDVTPWPTGIVIVPSGWTQAAGPGTPSSDSYFIEIDPTNPSGSTLDLGAHSLISTNLYEGTGYVIPNPALTVSGASYAVTEYTVAITPGAHMSLASGSGELTQTGGGALTTIVLTADEGYYFPKDYAEKNFTLKDCQSISAKWSRNGLITKITINGIPSKDLDLVLPDAELYIYPVWIGGVRVTALNKDDLVAAINEAAGTTVATGTAVYTPGPLSIHSTYPEIVNYFNGTLTLTDFTYNGEGYKFESENDKYAALYVDARKVTYPWTYSEYALTVELNGTNSITQHVSSSAANSDDVYGIYMYGGGNRDQGIDFKGSGSLTATADVVDSKNIAAGLYIYGHCNAAGSVDVTFIGPSGNALASSGVILRSATYYLHVGDDAKITAKGETAAVQDNTTGSYYSIVNYAAPYYLNVGTLSDGSNASAYAGTGNDNAKDLAAYKYLSFEKADLFVAGFPVAGGDVAAAVNAVYPGSVTGSASYDPNTHTLTLSGADITNISTGTADTNYHGMVYYGSDALTIDVTGDNSVTSRTRNGSTYGIYVYNGSAGLKLTGSGKLACTGANTSGSGSTNYTAGIYAYGGLTVDGPAVEAYGGSTRDYSYGIYSGKTLTLTSGSIKAAGGSSSTENSYGICGSVQLDAGEITATGGSAYYYSYGINGNALVKGGVLTATGGTANYDPSFGISGTLTQSGGEVYANGGDSTNDYSYGLYSATVNGGTLTVTSGDGGDGTYGIYSSLTVNDGTVNITSGTSASYSSYGVDSSVTVNGGKTTITTGAAPYACGIYGTLTVNSGEIYVNALSGTDTDTGVRGTVKMNGGTAVIKSGDASSESYAIYGYPDIRGGSLELIADGSSAAQICTSTPSLSEKAAVLTVSPNADASSPVPFVKEDYATYKYLKTGQGYALWVGGVQVSSENIGDVLGDGKVSFIPETSTLKINGASITNTNDDKAVIHYNDNEQGALTIEFSGTTTLTNSGTYTQSGIYSGARDSDYNNYPLTIKLADGAVVDVVCPTYSTGYGMSKSGIQLWSDLTIDGAGTFNITGPDLTGTANSGSTTALYANNLILSGGATLNASGGDCDGVSSDRTNDSHGIYLSGNLTIGDGCTLNAKGGSVIGSENYSYPCCSIGICIYPGKTVTLNGSAKALVKGGTYVSGTHGGSHGLMAPGYDSGNITFSTTDWTGEFDIQGDTGHSVLYYRYRGFYITRNPLDADATVYANIADTEGEDVTGPYVYVYGRDTTDQRLLIYPRVFYDVTVNGAAGIAPTAVYNESVANKSSMTPQVYTAADGYYFPADYAVAAVNGITVTRDSYTQITVSGSPTAAATVTLVAATAKAKLPTPTATFTATGETSGVLTISLAGAYTLTYKDANGGDTLMNITQEGSSSWPISSIGAGTISITRVPNPADAADLATSLASDAQTISVTKAAAPSLTAVQPAVIGGKGSIITNATHEISSDGTTWTACSGISTPLDPGTYYVRTAAAGTALTSAPQTIVINEFVPSKEATPTAVFTAAGAAEGTLSGVLSGQKYSLDNTVWTAVLPPSMDLTGLTPGTIFVIMPGNGTTSIDSDTQSLAVTKAAAPSLTATQPAAVGDKGSIPTTTAHEFSTDGSTWTACTGVTTGLSTGTYYVRTAASGNALASNPQTIVIELPKAAAPSLTAVQPAVIDGTGSIPTTAGLEISTDGLSWTATTGASEGLAPGTYYVRTAATTEQSASDPQTIVINEFVPSKEATPSATLSITVDDSGKLSGVGAGMKYSTDGSTWTDITADGLVISDLEPGKLYIRTKGNGTTTVDSDPQTISITKAETPALTAVQPDDADGSGSSIPTTSAHEYSADGGVTWVKCSGALNDLEQGSYLVRVAASGTVLASDPETIVIKYAPEYIILSGAGSVYVLPEKTDAAEEPTEGETPSEPAEEQYIEVRSNGKYKEFLGIQVDGKDVDKSLYTSREGSTIVTLPASYLDTLAPGEHTLTFLFSYGQVSAPFTVKPAVPQTGESSVLLWGVLLGAAVLAAAGTAVYSAKRRKH